MAYGIKWVTEHLGISKKTVLYYEGYVGKEKQKNPNHTYIHPKINIDTGFKEYTNDDLEILWTVKLLVAAGYSHAEIQKILEGPEFDISNSIDDKIAKMKRKEKETKLTIGFLKAVKLTGRIPVMPKEIGTMSFNEFLDYSLHNWNVDLDKDSNTFSNDVYKYIDGSNNLIPTMSPETIIELLREGYNFNAFMYMEALIGMLAEPPFDNVSAKYTQNAVKLWYMQWKEIYSEYENSVEKFVDYNTSYFSCGDISRINKMRYGEEACQFIVNALEYFGENYEN